MKNRFSKFISNINIKYLFVIVPVVLIVILVLLSIIFGTLKITKNTKEELKDIVLKTKDEKVSFIFKESYKKSDTGEYDLYAKDEDRQLITGIFTYNLSEYEENSAKEILNNQIEYFIKTRNDMKIYKKETVTDYKDKIITRIEYSGKTTDSSDCIYIFSTIEFKNNSDYVIYSNQVLLKSDYDKYSKELKNIISSAKLE